MTKQVQAVIAEQVSVAERGEAQTSPRPFNPPWPELLPSVSVETLGVLIPKAKMKVDRERNIRVEKVTAPLPAGLADHHRQVIRRELLQAIQRLIAEIQHRQARLGY